MRAAGWPSRNNPNMMYIFMQLIIDVEWYHKRDKFNSLLVFLNLYTLWYRI
jgi:hypothetical protein